MLNWNHFEQIRADLIKPNKVYVDTQGNKISFRTNKTGKKSKVDKITMFMILKRYKKNERIKNQIRAAEHAKYIEKRE